MSHVITAKMQYAKINNMASMCCDADVYKLTRGSEIQYFCHECKKILDLTTDWYMPSEHKVVKKREGKNVSVAKRPRMFAGDKVENKWPITTKKGLNQIYKEGEFKGVVILERILPEKPVALQLIVVKLENGKIDIAYSDSVKRIGG